MLRWVHIARLAYHHSPEKEQRLLARVSDPSNPATQGQNAGFELDPNLRIDALQARSDDDMRKFLAENRTDLTGILRAETDVESLSGNDVVAVMHTVRQSIIQEIAEEEGLAKAIAMIDSSRVSEEEAQTIITQYAKVIERYDIHADSADMYIEKLQALFHNTVNAANKEAVRLYAEKRNTGPKWSFLRQSEFEEKYGESLGRFPKAFVQNGTVYFNIDDPAFSDPLTRDAEMERTIAHEVTHIAVAEKKETMTRLAHALEKMPMWEKLKNLVTSLVGEDEIRIMSGKVSEAELIAEEALAIYQGERAAPSQATDGTDAAKLLSQSHADIADTMGTMLGSLNDADLNKEVHEMMVSATEYRMTQTWNAQDQKSEGAPLSDKLRESVDTASVQQKLLDGENAFLDERRRNNPPDQQELEKKLRAESEKVAKEMEEFTVMQKNIRDCEEGIKEIRSNDDALLSYIEKTYTDATEKAEQMAAFDNIKEELSGYGTDLILMKKYAEALSQWPTLSITEKSKIAESFSANPYAALGNNASEAAIKAADDATKADRVKMKDEIAECLAPIMKRVELQKDINKRIDENSKKGKAGEQDSSSLWGWFKKNIYQVGTSGSVVWVTPMNMMRIFTIYKEAIVENYKSNQSLKEYNLAKKLNVYKPIEHTLKKQAKSANEKETGEFKEYIEREGYTFDEIFGSGGKAKVNGLLYENKHNFNRAKAVILYAADHGWLYHMDRFNGRDVYGIDYEKEEGTKSFEELVVQYENGKEKEEKHGYEKVDKHPDITFMIHDMREELSRKNIFAVRGIIKRIQEKAKLGEANTWVAAEIVRAMRNPEIMAVMDKGFLDDVGNIGIGQSAWTLTLFKLMRHDFDAFRKGKRKSLEENNVFVSAVKKIQDLLEKEGLSVKNDDVDTGMDRTIGKVLAGQTVDINGKKISIFQDIKEFNEYRQFWATTPTSTEPGKTDDDYFNPANQGSDLLMLPKTSIQAILVRTSQGQWTHGTRAPNYLAQVILRDNDLAKNDPEAREIFRKEMKQRMSYFFGEAVSHGATRENFGDDTTPTSGTQPEISDLNILMELWQRNLISQPHFEQLAYGLKEDSTVPKGLKELRAAKKALDAAKAEVPVDKAKESAAKSALALAMEKAKTANTKE